MPLRFVRLTTGLSVLALVAAACGSTPEAAAPVAPPPASVAGPPSSPGSIPPAAAEQALPAVEVIDLADDARVNVASLVPAAKPVLVWFWAPH